MCWWFGISWRKFLPSLSLPLCVWVSEWERKRQLSRIPLARMECFPGLCIYQAAVVGLSDWGTPCGRFVWRNEFHISVLYAPVMLPQLPVFRTLAIIHTCSSPSSQRLFIWCVSRVSIARDYQHVRFYPSWAIGNPSSEPEMQFPAPVLLYPCPNPRQTGAVVNSLLPITLQHMNQDFLPCLLVRFCLANDEFWLMEPIPSPGIGRGAYFRCEGKPYSGIASQWSSCGPVGERLLSSAHHVVVFCWAGKAGRRWLNPVWREGGGCSGPTTPPSRGHTRRPRPSTIITESRAKDKGGRAASFSQRYSHVGALWLSRLCTIRHCIQHFLFLLAPFRLPNGAMRQRIDRWTYRSSTWSCRRSIDTPSAFGSVR